MVHLPHKHAMPPHSASLSQLRSQLVWLSPPLGPESGGAQAAVSSAKAIRT
jgi:hypothetical protein